MDNYYEMRLSEIRLAISENKFENALVLLDEELNMPYVPQPYLDEFKTLRDSIRIDTAPQAKYFESIEDIGEAFLGNDALKLKAIMSLERLNLRAYLNEIEIILSNQNVDDWMKRQILIFLIDQNINRDLKVHIAGDLINLNPSTLENPIGSKEYIDTYEYLIEKLESENPSLLMLCIAELDQMTMENFPVHRIVIKGEEIIKRVNQYLNAG